MLNIYTCIDCHSGNKLVMIMFILRIYKTYTTICIEGGEGVLYKWSSEAIYIKLQLHVTSLTQ